MRSLQVKELPDSLYRKLSDLAHKEHRSISEQTIILLSKSLDDGLNHSKRKAILDEILTQSEELRKYNLKDPVLLIREEREKL